MKLSCESCRKTYDSDQDELCPHCGAYNPIDKFTTDRQLREEASDSRRFTRHYQGEVAVSQNDMADVASSAAHNSEYGGSYEAAHGRQSNGRSTQTKFQSTKPYPKQIDYDAPKPEKSSAAFPFPLLGIFFMILAVIALLFLAR